ncbi:MAG: aspartate aminotransferase family protein, partial [Planctomycetota bacterium]
SGTEAVEAAIKFARRHTGRSGIVGWDDGFHGFTLGSLSVSGNRDLQAGFGELVPACRTVPFGDLDALGQQLARGDVAAVLIEPVQGKTLRSLRPGDGRAMHELCRRHGALLIADEVQTGLGRTGTFLACEQDGIEPDLVALSKGMSGGFVPVGAVLVRPHVWNSTYSSMERAFVHSSTHHEGPMAMVAVIAALEAIHEERLVERAAALGARIAGRLRRALAGSPVASEVRGRGLMLGIDIRNDAVPAPRGVPVISRITEPMVGQALVADLCRKERVLAQVTGARRTVLKLLPPLVIDEADAEWIECAVPAAVARLSGGSVFGAIASAAGAIARTLVPGTGR